MKPILLCVLCALGGQAVAADALKSKTTYAKAYGETKNQVVVDPAKDLPRYPAVEPKDAVATWKVKKGFKVEFAAHEPQVRSPIAVSYDEKGRMFVVEMIDYSEMRDVTPHLGRVSMLEDKDGDGYYETSTVFADNLPWPTGVICANGGIYVIATPDVYFFKDTKGTGTADVREVVFTGFGTGLKLLNVQGLANCPQWGLDNRIHIQSGPGNKGVVSCLKRPDLKGLEISGHDFWFDPRTLDFGLEAGGAQYGMSYDNYGRKFACGNSDHLQYYLYDEKYAHRPATSEMPSSRQSIAADGGAAEVYRISPDEPWRIMRTRWRIAGVVKGAVEGGGRVSGYFTGATGTTMYRGDVYGDDFLNNSFTGDAGGQLVHRKKIYADGVSLIGRRPDDEQKFEFAASTDTWVRVVNFANAPDGCLNIIDMYREVIEHPWSIPDEIKKHVDLNNGNDRGRIYRIVPENAATHRGTKVALDKASIGELVETLGHPNGWHRDTAARLLYERNDKAAVPLLQALVLHSKNPLAKIHALGVLEGFGALTEEVVIKTLKDADPRVREHGLTASEALLKDGAPSHSIAKALQAMSADADQRVRFQLALTLSLWSAPANDQPGSIKRMLAARDGDDPLAAAALLLGDPSIYVSGPVPSLSKTFLAKAVRATAAMNKPGSIPALIDYVAAHLNTSDGIRALGEGLRRAGTSIEKADTGHKLAAIFTKAASTALDAKAGESSSLEAIELLGLTNSKEAGAALLASLAEGRSDTVQAAAVKTLAQRAGAEVTKSLIAGWPHYGAKAKEAALTAFVARDDRTLALLGAVQAGAIKATDLSASQVQSLVHHKDAKVVALAKTALAAVIPPSREEVTAKFKAVVGTKGDAKRGQLQYLARCIACHRAGAQGIAVGPDLITVKTKGRDGILTAILEPSKEVAAQFIAYTVGTKDGQTFTGIIAKDDASSLTLRLMGGIEQTIQRSNIKTTSSTGSSLMPDGLETGMSVQDMADLITFVEELK